MLEEVKKSLESSPIVKKGDYNYFVNPISDGVPAMDPKMLRELSLAVHKHADLDVDKIVARQLISNARADDLGAVQTQNRVNDRICAVIRHQLLGNCARLAESRLLRGNVDIVIGVAVHGGKMSLCHTQEHILVLRSDFIHFSHADTSCIYYWYLSFYIILRKNASAFC